MSFLAGIAMLALQLSRMTRQADVAVAIAIAIATQQARRPLEAYQQSLQI